MIDAIAALVILSVALPPLVGSFAEGARQSIRPMQTSIASFLATERMEQIIALRHTAGGYSLVTTDNFPDESPVSGFAAFNRTATITEVAASNLSTAESGSGLKKVTVNVTWDGGARKVSVSRLFADY